MNRPEDIHTCDPYELIEALMHSSKAVELRLDGALAPIGVSATKWNALRQIAEGGSQLPLGELAQRLACVKSNATQLIDRLEAEKLVRRVPDSADRRRILAELTEEGRQVYTAGLAVIQRFNHELLNEFHPEEHRLLHKLLTRLRHFAPETH